MSSLITNKNYLNKRGITDPWEINPPPKRKPEPVVHTGSANEKTLDFFLEQVGKKRFTPRTTRRVYK